MSKEQHELIRKNARWRHGSFSASQDEEEEEAMKNYIASMEQNDPYFWDRDIVPEVVIDTDDILKKLSIEDSTK